MKIVFLGNHNVGIESLKVILRSEAHLVGVVAHPKDKEEGNVYDSLYDFIINKKIPIIRGKAKDLSTYKFILNLKPDLIWITDYKFLIPKKIIKIPNLGVVNLHPSLLPKFRGRAPLNWAIIEGERVTGITAHFVDEGIDTGPIISQIKIEINKNDYIDDVLNKLYPIYKKITSRVLRLIMSKEVKLKVQDHSNHKIYPKRNPEDGLIDWSENEIKIINLIRAVSRPYPGAFFISNNKKIILWKANFIKENHESQKRIGEIISIKENIKIKTKNGFIESYDWEKIY